MARGLPRRRSDGPNVTRSPLKRAGVAEGGAMSNHVLRRVAIAPDSIYQRGYFALA